MLPSFFDSTGREEVMVDSRSEQEMFKVFSLISNKKLSRIGSVFEVLSTPEIVCNFLNNA